MGEGIGNEELLMPFITAANIACGYHAGNDAIMQKTVRLCLQHQVKIGAHPSFSDTANFGRIAMQLTGNEIYELVTTQLNIINKIVVEENARLHHVKPHGALYNMAVIDKTIAYSMAKAVKDFDPSLIFYGLSGSLMIKEAEGLGLPAANEVFADRSYQSDGTLTPRSLPGALLTKTGDVIKQVMNFVKENKVITVTGEEIFVKADTICIHGDGQHAVEFARSIHKQLHEN